MAAAVDVACCAAVDGHIRVVGDIRVAIFSFMVGRAAILAHGMAAAVDIPGGTAVDDDIGTPFDITIETAAVDVAYRTTVDGDAGVFVGVVAIAAAVDVIT